MSDIELSDGAYTAVVDNIEDGLARVFFERDDTEVGSAIIEPAQFPAEARHANAILSVKLVDGAIESASYEPEQTDSRRKAAQDRFDRLSKRPPCDKDETAE